MQSLTDVERMPRVVENSVALSHEVIASLARPQNEPTSHGRHCSAEPMPSIPLYVPDGHGACVELVELAGQK